MAGLPAAASDLAAHYAPYAWFALTWTIPLVVVCAAGVWAAGAGEHRIAMERGRPATATRPRPLWLAVAASLLGVFLIAYSFLIPYHEDLIGLDYATITAGRFVDVPIWPSTGRFFPLALQEYNVLGLFDRSAALYHAFSVAELVLVVLCVFRILDDVPGWLRCCATMFVLALPSFFVSFFGLVYPERDLVVWFALWLVCWRSFDRTGSRAAFCGALIAAQFALYYKEPVFLLIGGFAVARLAIDAVRDRGLLRRSRYHVFAKAHALEFAHLALCLGFIAVYFIMVGRHVTSSYATNADAPMVLMKAAASYAGSDFLVDAFVVAFIARMISLVVRRRAPDPLWDALAAGALLYALAFVKLGLTRDYYLAPTDFIGTLYLARLAYLTVPARPALAGVLAALLAGWVFQRNVSDAAYRLLARKQYVEANVQLAAFLRSYSRAHGGRDLELFFPQVGGFELMELSSFLRLKGFAARGASPPAGTAGPGFRVKSRHRFANDLCLSTQSFQCLYAPGPAAGDLVVYPPGHEPSQWMLDSLHTAGTEVFHFRPAASGVERAVAALVPRDRLADASAGVRVFAYAK